MLFEYVKHSVKALQLPLIFVRVANKQANRYCDAEWVAFYRAHLVGEDLVEFQRNVDVRRSLGLDGQLLHGS